MRSDARTREETSLGYRIPSQKRKPKSKETVDLCRTHGSAPERRGAGESTAPEKCSSVANIPVSVWLEMQRIGSCLPTCHDLPRQLTDLPGPAVSSGSRDGGWSSRAGREAPWTGARSPGLPGEGDKQWTPRKYTRLCSEHFIKGKLNTILILVFLLMMYLCTRSDTVNFAKVKLWQRLRCF